MDLTKATVPVVTAFSTLGSSGKAASDALRGFADKTGPLSGSLGKLITAMDTGKDRLQEAGQVGIGGNNLLGFNAATASAGMTMAEYTKLAKESGSTLSSLGGNAQLSSSRLLKLAEDVQTNPISEALLASGVLASELTKTAAIAQLILG